VERVLSFGFRGEALSSICALSSLSVITKTEQQSHATEIVFDHMGGIVSTAPARLSSNKGTVISIRDLFKHLPVRQKEFVKNIRAYPPDVSMP
jgi:DNA mismatch repair protein PMS2